MDSRFMFASSGVWSDGAVYRLLLRLLRRGVSVACAGCVLPLARRSACLRIDPLLDLEVEPWSMEVGVCLDTPLNCWRGMERLTWDLEGDNKPCGGSPRETWEEELAGSWTASSSWRGRRESCAMLAFSATGGSSRRIGCRNVAKSR